MRTDALPMEDLEHALTTVGRIHGNQLIHHRDRGSQYVSLKYSMALAESGIRPSVGIVGDSYDNALAETVNGLYKAELIYPQGPWTSVGEVELATLRWVHWWNTKRLHEALDYAPPGSRNLVPPHPARQCGVVKEAELNPGRFIRWILYVGTLSRELSLSILNTSQGRIPLISNRSSGVKAGVTSFSRSNDSIRRLLISIYALTRRSSNFIKVSIT